MTSMQSILARLSQLSTRQLDDAVVQTAGRYRRQHALLIAHLAEVQKRRRPLELGYKGLFDYCVRRLGASEGATSLRVQVANVCLRFPTLLEALQQGDLSLTVAGRIAPHLTEENAELLIRECRGMTRSQAQEHLANISPRREVSAGWRSTPKPQASSRTPATPSVPPRPAKDSEVSDASEARRPASSLRPGVLRPCAPDRFNVHFAADRSFKEKLQRLAEILGIESPQRNLATVLERALDEALERRDPQKRLERREKRKAQTEAPTSPAKPVKPDGRSRHIPHPLRDRLLARADYQCEYQGPDGVRCEARTRLEVDHQKPFARGGSHRESNLRVLCRPHNAWFAERDFGSEFIRSKVVARS